MITKTTDYTNIGIIRQDIQFNIIIIIKNKNEVYYRFNSW